MNSVIGSDNYAEVALDIWTPSKRLSDELRDLIPSTADLLAEIRRHQVPGVELMPAAHNGRSLRLAADVDREYMREKFYVRVLLDSLAVRARDVDVIRRAVFEGAALVGKHIAFRVCDVIESLRPPLGASVEWSSARASHWRTPMTVRFTGQPMMLPEHHWSDGTFACFDYRSDRVVFHMATYFTVAPVGEAVIEP